MNKEKLKQFDFNLMYKEITENYNDLRKQMDESYKAFFCSICDGNNHKFFNVEKNALIMNFGYCHKLLKENRKMASQWNVKLIEILDLVQNEVDCKHYKINYNLPFFNKKFEFMKETMDDCLNNLFSEQFEDKCQIVCQQMPLANINYFFEGDFEFLIKSVEMFTEFDSF